MIVTRDRLRAVSLSFTHYIYSQVSLMLSTVYHLGPMRSRKSQLFPIKIARAPWKLLLRILLEQVGCIPPIYIYIHRTSPRHLSFHLCLYWWHCFLFWGRFQKWIRIVIVVVWKKKKNISLCSFRRRLS